MRQIVMDTETTGIDPKEGHKIIEIGAIELVNRRFTGRTYHQYINPQREIEAEAIGVHGITNERVANEPVFAQIADDFWQFIDGAQLIIHNAPFDLGFMNHEFLQLGANQPASLKGPVEGQCTILDTLQLARQRHPGQRNNLDALCKRYAIDNTQRVLHGALLDSEILAEVYLAMTGGQTALSLAGNDDSSQTAHSKTSQAQSVDRSNVPLLVTALSEDELKAHEERLAAIRKIAGSCVWDSLQTTPRATDV